MRKTVKEWYARPVFKIISIAFASFFAFFLLVSFLPRPTYKDGFRNLTELKEYATTIDEFIKRENENALDPVYEKYYKKAFSYALGKNIREKFVWLFSFLGLAKKPIFSASFFKTLLEDVLHVRQKKGWGGNFVQKFEVTPTSKTVVFGCVQGAFHGLVRYLVKLKELGIIDENLKILQPDYRFIFLGDIVNRSPYTLEIFSIILRLLQVNSENVIYLKDVNELPDYWRRHTLRRELEIRVDYLSNQDIPLAQEIDAFFDTLPMNIYGAIPSDKVQPLSYMRISSYAGDQSRPSELVISDFLKEKSGIKLESFDLSKIEQVNNGDGSGKDVLLRAVVKDIRKRDDYQRMDGLRLLNFEGNVAAWTVYSTAAGPYCMEYGMVYDAFVIITPANELDKWLITLYNRDVRDKDTSFKNRSCYFFSGEDVKNTNVQ